MSDVNMQVNVGKIRPNLRLQFLDSDIKII